VLYLSGAEPCVVSPCNAGTQLCLWETGNNDIHSKPQQRKQTMSGSWSADRGNASGSTHPGRHLATSFALSWIKRLEFGRGSVSISLLQRREGVHVERLHLRDSDTVSRCTAGVRRVSETSKHAWYHVSSLRYPWLFLWHESASPRAPPAYTWCKVLSQADSVLGVLHPDSWTNNTHTITDRGMGCKYMCNVCILLSRTRTQMFYGSTLPCR